MYTQQTFQIDNLKGISSKNIEEHLKLYTGYVKNSNLVSEKIKSFQGDENMSYELGELYRHFSFEYNGMRNHECYFSLLSGDTRSISSESKLAQKINEQFSSFENYLNCHMSMAATTRGIGWAMLSFDPAVNTLILHWVDEQHFGQLQSTTPIIALDMWEHSYVADYQPSGKKQYIQDFFDSINWSVAELNYESALNK